MDETHTICAGPGGHTSAHGLDPDILTIGKPIAAGIPASAYGFSANVADRLEALLPRDECEEILDLRTHGIGSTIVGSPIRLVNQPTPEGAS